MAASLTRYVCDFDVYTRSTGEKERALVEKVVLVLSDSIQRRYHQLFYFCFREKLFSPGTYSWVL